MQQYTQRQKNRRPEGEKSDKKSMLGASTTFFQMLAVQLSVGCQPCLPPSPSSTFFSDPNTVSGLREGPSHCVPDRDSPPPSSPASAVNAESSPPLHSTPSLVWSKHFLLGSDHISYEAEKARKGEKGGWGNECRTSRRISHVYVQWREWVLHTPMHRRPPFYFFVGLLSCG